MSLKFRTLTVTDFGPYQGRQVIDLDTDDESPVVLIYGQNTLGKTQLFSALRWCLYGTFAHHQTLASATVELPGRLNLPAKRSGTSELEVSIDFEANGVPYHLTRKARFFGDGDRVRIEPDLRIGSSVTPTTLIDIEIGRVLHPQISEFFLFDGELLETFYERLSTDRERALIRNSIEAVLGIPALQLAQHDVDELASEAAKRQAKLIENRSESEKIQQKLDQLADEATSIETDKKLIADNLAEAEARAKDTREKLSAIESLQADVREQETLEAQFNDGSREELELQAELRALLGSGWRSLANAALAEKLAEIRKHNSAVERRNQSILAARNRVTALEDRARGGICPTCKQQLQPPSNDTEQELIVAREELQTLLDETGGGSLDLDLERRIAALVDRETAPRYLEKHGRLVRVQMLQYERKQRLGEIGDRLQGHEAADIRALGTLARQLETAIEGFRAAQNKNEREADKANKEQTRLTRGLQKIPGASGSAQGFEFAFYRFIEDLLDKTVAAFREDVRSRVQIDATNMFLQLIHDPTGYKGLSISADYQIELLSSSGEPRETSQGGRQLLALSLIGALKKAAVRGGPVVLDSPLGRLDLEHRSNVLKTWIPNLGAQAILLVQDGELTMEDANGILGSKIGRSYVIVRPTSDPEVAKIERVA